MNEFRPDPDALLGAARKEELARTQGKLRIFLGMSPGVGKTYAMLLAAQQRQEEGVDVVIGWIETHGRIETLAMTAGLARISRRKMQHRGVDLEEMDLDAILARAPELVVVDELAHSNMTGGRHPKRYQDVLELLEAGIDVYTTINVQHIESHRDVVSQITGAPVHESVPDSAIDRADEIELVDISPEQLRKRLDEGKVYIGDRAAAASDNFFREGNLKALREIALRVTAERADRELREFMRSRSISGPWKPKERFLVAVAASPFSEHLIRWTCRIVTLTHGAWMAVFIDSGRLLGDEEKNRLEKNLNLARSLGAEVLTTVGTDVTDTLIRMAHEHNATQIVVGKPLTHPLLDLLRGGSLVDKLIRRSGDIDVYVVRAEKTAKPWRPDWNEFKKPLFLRECGYGLGIVLTTTVAGLLLNPLIGYMAVGLLYLLAVLLGSVFLSRWPILVTGSLSALAWNYLFITPHYTFYISNVHDIILFGLYFVVALIMGQMSSRLRQREKAERRREEQATALYYFCRDLVSSRSLSEGIQEGVRHIDELFGVAATVFAGSQVEIIGGRQVNDRELAVAKWSFDKKEVAGRFTNTLPQSEGIYLPLRAGEGVVGVLGVRARAALSLSERQLLETFATQLALLVERDRLTGEAEAAKIEEKSLHLQKTLLDSVSHEFKTPLAVISTAVEGLRSKEMGSQPLLEEIRIAAARLNRIVANLLDITRIETGAVRPKLVWSDLREIIERALHRVRSEVGQRRVEIKVDDRVAACLVDPGLLEEILGNLLRNASQYSPEDSILLIVAGCDKNLLILSVIDEGPGVPDDKTSLIFDKFHRLDSARPCGLGLGLSIVKGLAEALGGVVRVMPRAGQNHGAEFRIELPVETKSVETIAATQ